MIKKIMLILSVLILPINTLAITEGTKTEVVTFSKCVDGDTARFKRGAVEIKVRFLAIDTPETVDPRKEVEEYGKEASTFTCDKITKASKIELEYDPNSDEKDNYDRYLAWVYVDGKLLQDSLIKEGYAKVAYIYGDYLYTDDLRESEEIARKEKRGIWANETAEKTTTKDDESKTKENKPKSIFEQIADFIGKIIDKILKFMNDLIDSML